MNNSAICRSNSLKNSKKLSVQGIGKQIQSVHSIRSFDQYSQKNSQQQSQQKQRLFTPFRRQSARKEQRQYSKMQLPNKSLNLFQTKKSTPLFLGYRNQEQVLKSSFEQKQNMSGKYNNNQKVSNDLVKTKHTFKQSLDNSLNDQLCDSQIQINQESQVLYKRDQNQKQFFKKKQINEDIEFGEGLQEIEKRKQKAQFIKDLNLKMAQNPLRKSIQSQTNNKSPTLAQVNSKLVRQKRQSYRQSNDGNYRSTSSNFYKRPPSSSGRSQQYLKSQFREQYKTDHRESLLNAKSSINASKQKQQKQSIFFKTQTLSRQKNDTYFSYRNKYLPMAYETYQNQMNRFQRPYLSFANNLSKLVFKYNGGHANTLFNYRLKIKNQSQVRLGIKIKSTSPRHYEVSPCSDITLQPLEILSLSIEMKLYPHDLNPITMKHDLSRYKNDKFMIFYWTAQSHNDFDYYESQRIFPVCIEQTAEEKLRNQGFVKNVNEEKTKQVTEQKQIQVYKKFIDSNTLKMVEIDGKIKKIESIEYKHKYFTIPLFIMFILIGLALGFWMG